MKLNDPTLLVERRHVGGVKQSGTGRNGSWHGMGEFTAFKDMLLAGLDR